MVQSLLHQIKKPSVESIRLFLLYSLFFAIIIQTGKHFWPEFAFVFGVRVDYLSPTLYFSDIIIIFLFTIELVTCVIERRYRFFLVGGGIVLALLLYVPFVNVVPAHFFGVLSIIKFIFVGYIVARYFSYRDIKALLTVLSFAVLVESFLILAQFVFQSSVQGLFYYLGERAISVTTIGAATFNMGGFEVFRAYGTFPHPNVAAFFIYFALVFLILLWKTYGRGIYLFSILLGSTALLLTFSRVTVFLYGVFLLWYFFRNRKKYLIILLSVAVALYVAFFSSRFSAGSLLTDLTYRRELFEISLKMMENSWLFGSGLGNYFYTQVQYHTQISPIFLQPVHNIYVLVLLQVGVVGGLGVLFLLGKTLFRAYSTLHKGHPFDTAVFILLSSVLIVGVFDHFFLTLQQGMLMVAVLIGFVWRNSK